MNQLMENTSQEAAPFGPQSRAMMPAGGNSGAVAIESQRAIAEAQGQIIIAKRFPRDLNAAYAELMESCKIPALANMAFYSVPQGGGKVTGPSIRLAEEIARVYGNFEFGHRELGRTEATPTTFGRSEIEVFAWDKEKNNRSLRQITVLHVLDTKDGPRRLRDQKDIDNKIANIASKQARGRILAMMPKWMVEAAIEECKKTIAGTNAEPLSVRVRKMTQAFSAFGVTTEHLERHLKHKLDDVLLDELVDLTGIFNSLKEGSAPSEFFGDQDEATKAGSLAETARKGAAAAVEAAQQSARNGTTEQAAIPTKERKPTAPKTVKPSEPATEPLPKVEQTAKLPEPDLQDDYTQEQIDAGQPPDVF